MIVIVIVISRNIDLRRSKKEALRRRANIKKVSLLFKLINISEEKKII